MAWVAALGGVGAHLVQAPCVASRELAPWFDRLGPGTRVLVVSEKPHWRTVASLAAERRLVSRPSADFNTGEGTPYRWALATEAARPAEAGWTERSRARGWVLWEREAPAP